MSVCAHDATSRASVLCTVCIFMLGIYLRGKVESGRIMRPLLDPSDLRYRGSTHGTLGQNS